MPFGDLIRRYLPSGDRKLEKREERRPVSRERPLPPDQYEGEFQEGFYRELPNGNGNGNGKKNGNGNGNGRPRLAAGGNGDDMAAGKGKKKRNGKKFARAAGKAVGEAFTRGAEAGARGAGKAYRGAKGKYTGYRDEKKRTKAEEEAWWQARYQEAELGVGPVGIPPSKRKDLQRSAKTRIDHEFEVRQKAAELGIPDTAQHLKYDRLGRKWVPDLDKPSFKKSVAQLEREIQQQEAAIVAGGLQSKALEKLEKEEFPTFGQRARRAAGQAGKGAVKTLQADPPRRRAPAPAYKVRGARTPLQDLERPRSRGRPGSGMPRVSETLRPGSRRGRGSGGMPPISETLRPGKRKLPRF